MLRTPIAASAIIASLLCHAVLPARAADFVTFPAVSVGAWLSLPPAAPAGVAIIVPDASGRDDSTRPYVQALTARNIVALEIDAEDEMALRGLTGDGQAIGPDQPDMVLVLRSARQYLARDPRFAALPVALVGFGTGARFVADWAGHLPVAFVRHRCAGSGSNAGPNSGRGAAPAPDAALCALVSLMPVRHPIGPARCRPVGGCASDAPDDDRRTPEMFQVFAEHLEDALRAGQLSATLRP